MGYVWAELKDAIINAYVAVTRASALGSAATANIAGGLTASLSGAARGDPVSAYAECELSLAEAREQLLRYLGDT